MSDAVLEVGVRLAVKARLATAWASKVPWDVFLNDVVPYSVLNEARENWRPLFHEWFMPLVLNASSVSEAALALNNIDEGIWHALDVEFEAELSPQVSSPFETMAYRRASCTGLSVLLVAAYRAVGIPARLALVSAWAPPNAGNHAWVEVWVDGHWEFTGAFDGGSSMNETWFTSRVKLQDPSNASQRVYATTFKPLAPPLGRQLDPADVYTGGNAPVYVVDRTAYYQSVQEGGDEYPEGTPGGDDPEGSMHGQGRGGVPL